MICLDGPICLCGHQLQHPDITTHKLHLQGSQHSVHFYLNTKICCCILSMDFKHPLSLSCMSGDIQSGAGEVEFTYIIFAPNAKHNINLEHF